MIPPEKRERVLKLHALGKGIRWISRSLEISRNSVREILGKKKKRKQIQGTDPPGRESPLERYRKDVEEILQKDEEIRRTNPSAKPITATRVFKKIRKLGYPGGRTVVDEYVRELRGPTKPLRPSARFETAVAEEAQQDWSTYRVEIAGKLTVIQLFSMILAWSRYQFLKAYLDQKRHTLLWAHVAALRYFQGVPWKILYDQQRTIVACVIEGKPLLTEEFRSFAEHYGFEPAICQAGHKERKGKIERPFDTFERSFLPHRVFKSLEDFNSQLLGWLDGLEEPDEGNHRQHRTTGEAPYKRWLEEKQYLYELPPTDRLPRRIETRLVDHDATISVGGVLYSVPARLVERRERQVWAAIGEEDLLVYDRSGELVAQHKLSRNGSRLVIDEQHYSAIRRLKHAVTRSELERRFLEHFADSAAFLEGLKRTMRSVAPIHLREILLLARRYGREEVAAALRRAVADATTTAGYVRAILERKHPTGHLREIVKEPPRGLSLGRIDPGDSSGYGRIFTTEDNERTQ